MNVGRRQDGMWHAVSYGVEHGVTDDLRGQNTLWGETPKHGQHRLQQDAHPPIYVGARRDAVFRNDCGRPEDNHLAKRQPPQGVLRLTANTGPHRAAFLAAVCAGSGHIHHCHARIASKQLLRDMKREIVGHRAVCGLRHAEGGDSRTEETGIDTSERVAYSLETFQMRCDDNVEARIVVALQGTSADHDNLGDVPAPRRHQIADGCCASGVTWMVI